MNTLLLTYDFLPDTGGMARLYAELCRNFPSGTVEVMTVRAGTDPERGAIEPLADALGSRTFVHRLPFAFREGRRFPSVLHWTRWVSRRCRRGDVQLIQVGNIRPTGWVAAWVRRRQGVPYVIYVHGRDVHQEQRRARRSRFERFATRTIFGGASAVIANSRDTARRTEELLDLLAPASRPAVHVVHPGTDPERFWPEHPDGAHWRARLGLDGKRVLLSVSRLVRRKGIDTVLAALPALVGQHQNLVYLVAGHGPDEARLKRLARELGISDHVNFIGDLGHAALPGLYAAAEVFVLPVREEPERHEVEGFGMVFCEAGASGVPVVAGASGGVADAVRDGETGLLVPPSDPPAVAAALSRLLEDDELRRRLGAGGRAAVESYYNWERAAAEVWRILEQVAAPTAAAARAAAPAAS